MRNILIGEFLIATSMWVAYATTETVILHYTLLTSDIYSFNDFTTHNESNLAMFTHTTLLSHYQIQRGIQ